MYYFQSGERGERDGLLCKGEGAADESLRGDDGGENAQHKQGPKQCFCFENQKKKKKKKREMRKKGAGRKE